MGCFSGTGPNAEDMRLEPMDLYLGRRNFDCVTAVAGTLLDAKAFLFEVTDFDGVVVPYYLWYNTGLSTDPAIAGRTGIETAVVVGDTATEIATKSVVLLDAITGMTSKSEGAKFSIQANIMGAVTAAADVDTLFTFENDDAGSKEYLGGTEDITLTPEFETLDVKASQAGDSILSQLITAVNANIATSIKELTQARWESIVGSVIGTVVSGTPNLVGIGSSSIGKNIAALGFELLMKPVNSADNSRNITMYKTAPIPNSINFSGTELSIMEVTFTAYLDGSKNKGLNLWSFGDLFQDTVNA